MAVKRGGLGKGLDSLIPEGKNVKKTVEKPVEKEVKTVEQMIKLSKIEPNREQPRRNFEEDALLELADSIKQFGVLQPLLVQKKGDFYEIIAGERRWRAAKLAGLKEVPVIIKEYTKQDKRIHNSFQSTHSPTLFSDRNNNRNGTNRVDNCEQHYKSAEKIKEIQSVKHDKLKLQPKLRHKDNISQNKNHNKKQKNKFSKNKIAEKL